MANKMGSPKFLLLKTLFIGSRATILYNDSVYEAKQAQFEFEPLALNS